jgi:hypothetical protein
MHTTSIQKRGRGGECPADAGRRGGEMKVSQ